MRYRSLPLIAVRRMAGNWRLLASVAIGTVVAAAIISSTAIYSDAIRDLGLDFALDHHEEPAGLDVHVTQSTVGVDRVAYQRTRARVDPVVARALGEAAGPHVRQASTATFFPTEPGEAVSASNDRPRAFLRFRSDIEGRVRIVRGAMPDPVPSAEGAIIGVAIGRETAERNRLDVGARFDLHPFWAPDAAPLRVEVAAILEAIDPEDRYWGSGGTILDARTSSWPTYALFVPESTLFGAVAGTLSGLQADLADDYLVDFGGLDARRATEVADSIEGTARALEAGEPRLRLESELVEVLRTFDTKLFFTRIPLLIVLLQIAGIVAYYLLMVSTMLVERQAGEIALLRSRGGTTSQLLAQYAVEALILAALAAFVGPPLAALVISALGPTPAFRELSGGGLLPVHISGPAYALAAAGALIAFLALMVPAWRVTRTTMVEFKRSTARPRPTPVFLRYYLDVFFVVASALVFWRLSQQGELFATSTFGDLRSDPLLLLTPAVFLLTVGIVFLRLFPLLLRAAAGLLGRTRSTAVLVGMRSLVRNPTHYTRLILLLMFATGVGMFGASFSRTLDRSYADRAAYAVGADVRGADFRGLQDAGPDSAAAALRALPADAASPALRSAATLMTSGGTANIDLLGVEPSTFPGVAFFRSDFASEPLEEIARRLEADAIRQPGFAIPGTPRQIGAWVKAPDISGRIEPHLRIRDADGRQLDVLLGALRPDAPVTSEWRFAAAVLPPSAQLRPPLELTAYYLLPRGGIAGARGTVLLGPVLASQQAAEGPSPDDPVAEAFAGAELVRDMASLEGWQTIEGYRLVATGDRPVATTDAPPGFGGSVRYSWVDARRGPPLRGLETAVSAAPMRLYLVEATAQRLGLGVGDSLDVLVASKYASATVAGVVALFPTVRVDENDGFALANLERLLYAMNHSPGQRAYGPNEAWYQSSDPEALREALSAPAIGAQRVLDTPSERLAQQRDPLVAAGWQGILAIAFGAVLLLSAIGFLVYSYLTAQERALEFAIMRTLGFSRSQIFGVVAFEHVFVIAAGMGLGTLVGLQVGRLMMDFLGTDEQGTTVLPPFVLGVSWPSVFVAWGILGAVFAATIAAVVLLYVRLQVHRALRIGDV